MWRCFYVRCGIGPPGCAPIGTSPGTLTIPGGQGREFAWLAVFDSESEKPRKAAKWAPYRASGGILALEAPMGGTGAGHAVERC